MQPADKSTLVGFYGAETMEERIKRSPPLKVRLGRKKKDAKAAAADSAERQEQGVQEGEAQGGDVGREQEGAEGGGRRRRNWLSRKRTN